MSKQEVIRPSALLVVSTGRRVRDPELKRDTVSGKIVQTGMSKKRCEVVWSFVAEAILTRDVN